MENSGKVYLFTKNLLNQGVDQVILLKCAFYIANSANFKKFVKSLQVICTRDSTKVLKASLCLTQVPRGHEVLMKECIEIYQEFFVTFLSAKAFTGKNDTEFDPNGWLSKMVKRPNDTLEERTKYLEQLLQGTSKEIFQTV